MDNNQKSNYELVLEAQKEQVVVIANDRVALREDLDAMEKIGGKDDYESSLPAFLAKYNKGETTTDQLREVYPDARQLKKAITKLAKDGAIKVEIKGQTTFVALVKVEAPEAAAAEDKAAREDAE